MLNNNPWGSDSATLPSRGGSSKGLLHVLSSSESLGLSPTAPSGTSDAQMFSEALLQYVNLGQACAARQADSEIARAKATVSVIVGNSQQVQLLTDASDCVSTLLQQKETVIKRLQQPSRVPSLVVENSGQQALLSMLQEAALQPQASSCGMHAVTWAQHFKEAPLSWSAMLQPASDAAAAISLYHHGLTKAHEATRHLSDLVTGNN